MERINAGTTPKCAALRAVAMTSMTSAQLPTSYLEDIPLEAECRIAESWGEAH
jgi:hypothetical protein